VLAAARLSSTIFDHYRADFLISEARRQNHRSNPQPHFDNAFGDVNLAAVVSI
jgi:hypothetical protein